MSRFRFTIAGLVWVVAFAAIISGAFLVNLMLGLALFVAAGLGLAVFFLREDLANVLNAMLNLLRRPVGRVTLILLFAGIVTAPAVLFFDPATYAPDGEATSRGTRGSSTRSTATTWPTRRPRGPGIAHAPTCSSRITRISSRPGGW